MIWFLIGLCTGLGAMVIPFFLVVYVCVVRYARDSQSKPINWHSQWPDREAL